MKNKCIKNIVCAITALVFMFAFAGCGGVKPGDESKVDISSYIADIDSGNTDRITLTWMIPTQQSIVLSNTPAIKAAAEKFNINLVIKEEPYATHNNNLTLGLAGNTLTDIISWVSSANANANGPVGAYVNLRLYEEEMKNFTALRNAAVVKDADNRNILYNSDGNYYITPHYLDEPINLFDFGINISAFKEIKNKHNLTWKNEEEPSTWDEVEEVLTHYKNDKQTTDTKNKYYPLTYRNFQSMSMELQLFVESYTQAQATTLDFFGFNEAEDKFEFALNVEGYKEGVAKYADWYKKGLISPDKTADENNLKNQLYYGDCIMIGDYIGGWSGINYIQKDVGYKMYPLQNLQAPGKRRIVGRELHNFDSQVGTALNRNLTKNPEKLARAIIFLDYLYSDEFAETLWFNDNVTTKAVPDDKMSAPLSERKKYFTYNNDTVYNFSDGFDYQSLSSTYFPWSLCNGFIDYQDERPNPNNAATAEYINYRDNKLRAKYKEGYDRATTEYLYGKLPSVLLTTDEQERALMLETSVLEQYKLGISDFAEGKKNFEGDWNSFVNKLLSTGGREMIEIYNTAYNRGKN